MIRIKEAIKDHNTRKRDLNICVGLPPEEGTVTLQDVGRVLYPASSEDSIKMSMSNMINNKMPKISSAWVKILCLYLEVTPNFLFGYDVESKNKWI